MRLDLTVWCRACEAAKTVCRPLPAVCPHCHRVARWTSTPPYHLTVQDRRFLRSLHIDPETAIKQPT